MKDRIPSNIRRLRERKEINSSMDHIHIIMAVTFLKNTHFDVYISEFNKYFAFMFNNIYNIRSMLDNVNHL